MSNPTVCCVMLVNGRSDMLKRAIRSFQAQTYDRKVLVAYDSSEQVLQCPSGEPGSKILVANYSGDNRSIGFKRNSANHFSGEDIIIHWDSDDWSHPYRIAEQVALLQASEKECVGYRDMLFWNETPGQFCGAWLYTNGQRDYCLGTSLCYWRRVWEKRPFEDLPKGPMGMGEDHQWLQGVDALGVTSNVVPPILAYGNDIDEGQRYPRMIASVHGGNTTDIMRVAIQVQDKMLKRAPEWDKYCAGAMVL